MADARPNLFDLERVTLRDLVTLVESRAAAETAAKTEYQTAKTTAEKELSRARKLATSGRERDLAAILESHTKSGSHIADRHRDEGETNDREYADAKDRILREKDVEEKKARTALQDAHWTAESIFEAAEKSAEDDRTDIKRKGAQIGERIVALWNRTDPILDRLGKSREDFAIDNPAKDDVIVDPQRTIDEKFLEAETILKTLEKSAINSGFAVVAKLFVGKKVALAMGSFAKALADVQVAKLTMLRRAETEYARRIAEGGRIRDESKKKADFLYNPLIGKIQDQRTEQLREAGEKHARTKDRLRNWRADTVDRADEHFAGEKAACEKKYADQEAAASRTYAEIVQDATETYQASMRILSIQWRDGQDQVGRSLNKLRANGLEHFPDWSSPFWYNPPAAIRVPAGVRFGDFDIDLMKLPGGIPMDEDGEEPTLPIRMKLPAFLPFPDRCSLLLKAKDLGRARGVQALQAIMLRLLTAIPPGKLRFTVIDPVGLGENFAAFMHLADYDEQLIGSRIWTEPGHIEKRLTDITAHMETVIQKYLRNQYRTIEEYNAQAGEVAEPFRVLVIANFPANFTLDACRRLVSIINSGPSCGVYTLITHDPKQPVPQGFNLSDIEQGSINLNWKDETFIWKDPELARFPLELESPPSLAEMTRIVRLVGERSKDAKRVEVPFEFIAPKALEIWTGDSRHGVSVAIGRAGATKRQIMALGKGTAQHALIAGKTGSGKSTLLHALITNLVLNYSPDELELYLIDFKKGVEFKSYAYHRLPHARAVAIESEREFGLSVLQRLDVELKSRGDRFRETGVNSLAEFRDLIDKNPAGQKPMPRILLIVDEFQEFFVEDDKVSQECALLLDRLVRQGRAFGLHVILGSQTLGGAYSLARSTIDQMAVRIALQCSDADAQLILSKDNTAARLLSRPGEAIYNDQNGLVEGNDLFQVVWLDDDRKDKLLGDLRKRADALPKGSPSPLVFEGNIPSVIEKNLLLAAIIDAPVWSPVRAGQAWLGDAVAIKDPTAVTFRVAGGQNLLMVGQHDEGALAVLTSSLVSLSAQYAPGSAKLIVLDGTSDEDPHAGYLGRVASALDHGIRLVDRNDMSDALNAVAIEVTARSKRESDDRTPVYVFIHGVQRFRELRKEDDFGFGRRGAEKTVSPAEHIQTIVRDGPNVGIYLILWADTPTNLGRVIDRAGMREFGLRVLFQMSANDSSALIDTPAASRLGRNRALFVTEENPQPEKFRPYGLPPVEWLTIVGERLKRKANG
jgi:DNA segregation ATPase FtsK/SpoIIIE, S-DNA-T family